MIPFFMQPSFLTFAKSNIWKQARFFSIRHGIGKKGCWGRLLRSGASQFDSQAPDAEDTGEKRDFRFGGKEKGMVQCTHQETIAFEIFNFLPFDLSQP